MTDYMVIGRYRNIDNVRALIASIRAKGKTCYDFTAKPTDPSNPDANASDQMEALGRISQIYLAALPQS